MLISYDWLKKYFEKGLPPPEKINETLTFGVFEIEEMNQKGSDIVFDVKVLPDRACYALSHRGLAYELSALLDIPQKESIEPEVPTRSLLPLDIKVEEKECIRYIGRRINKAKIGESPAWIKEKLEALGQRSINSIVDVLNYVMLDMGQPLHAFDADKVEGAIVVRKAKEGEKIITLDGKEVALSADILIIADEKGPLAIAGIKGGKKAEVTSETKNLILEAANFDKASVRRSSAKVGIKNDSSKRFENGITASFAEKGMNEATVLIRELDPAAEIGETSDYYPVKETARKIKINPHTINSLLGIIISTEEISLILKRLDIGTEISGDEVMLSVPEERLDLVIAEDIAEEVGRLYGYEKIPLASLPPVSTAVTPNKFFFYSEKIKDILAAAGFSEVSTYALQAKGDFEIEKSIASDKNFLRTSLSEGVSKALELNLHNAPLLGLDQIKVFEIGKVFKKEGEHASLCVAIANAKSFKGEKENELIKAVREHLLKELQANVITICTIDDTGGILLVKNKQIGVINNTEGLMELDLDALIAALPDPAEDVLFAKASESETRYKSISSYPFVLRDIAVFIPGEMSEEKKVKPRRSFARREQIFSSAPTFLIPSPKHSKRQARSRPHMAIALSFSLMSALLPTTRSTK